jgi:RES domain-containing protein
LSEESAIVFRIARETRRYQASDITGAGAAASGGRWNPVKTPMVYASATRALAAWEALVHIAEPPGMRLPVDRYLLEIAIPRHAWSQRERFDGDANAGWDSIPGSMTALGWGTQWTVTCRSLVAVVPSVVVPEDNNVLINPRHPDAAALRVAIVRKWLYDVRLGPAGVD